MPDPTGAIIGAVQNVPSDIQAFSAAEINNRRSQKWNEKMYQRKYDDSIAFWNMQNAYNTPAAQMQRYKEAGLNPALMYGQGNSGNAGSIQVPDVGQPEFRTPNLQGVNRAMEGLLMSADLRIKQAQANNIETMTKVAEQDAMLRKTQSERALFDLDFERNLSSVSADARREYLRKLKTEIDVALDRNAREAAQNSSSLQEAAYRMLNLVQQNRNMKAGEQHTYEDIKRIRQQVDLMAKDGKLRQMDIELREKGINPNDPMWARLVGRFLESVLAPGDNKSTSWGDLFNFFK